MKTRSCVAGWGIGLLTAAALRGAGALTDWLTFTSPASQFCWPGEAGCCRTPTRLA